MTNIEELAAAVSDEAANLNAHLVTELECQQAYDAARRAATASRNRLNGKRKALIEALDQL